MLYSKQVHFVLVIDEFQELQRVNSSFFSQMQNIWDNNKDDSKINLIVCGSAYSMMVKIFEDSKEPLFGRNTANFNLKPFRPSVCKQILKDYNPSYTNEDLLCLYTLSGGIAKYIFLLMETGNTTKEKMLDYVTSITSPFLTDGKEILVSEMGKEYGVYFSILTLISRGMTTQAEIDSIIQKNTGAYLSYLEKVFGVIKPIKPLFAKAESRNARWQITDCFMRFYFKFIYSNQALIELGQLDVLKNIIINEYETYTGQIHEEYFAAKISEEKRLTKLGRWWDRKGENEIDIIAINDLDKTCDIYEVKRQSKRLSSAKLLDKTEVFKSKVMPELEAYNINQIGLSMDDM